MLEWRLKAFDRLQSMKEPDWQKPKYPKINYQDLYYYSAPKSLQDQPKSLDDIDPEIRKTYDKLEYLFWNKKDYQALPLMLFLIQFLLQQLLKKS